MSNLIRSTLMFLTLTLGSWGCSQTPQDNNSTSTSDGLLCSRGDLDCACEQGNLCSVTDEGVQLACVLGVCEPAPCEPGSVGCECEEGACGDGLECSKDSGVERCEVPGCEPGTEDCGCELDRGCGSGTTCVLGMCKSITCDLGSDGCACSQRYTCESGLTCNLGTSECQESGSCTPGNQGCECLVGSKCVDGLTCSGGACVDPSCSPGLEGCSCLDDSCGLDTNGTPMECSAGLCQSTGCPAGDAGCACVDGMTCAEGNTCVNGLCTSDECIPGQVGCGCLAGSCNPGLKCEDDTVCVDNSGKKGGPCLADGTCDRNHRCDDTVAPAVCTYCELGSFGCQCDDDDSCVSGLTCSADLGLCLGDETVFGMDPNEDAACYTPCDRDLTDESGTRSCKDGLLEGCVDGNECDKGSCVAPGASRTVCYEHTDCPFYQLCMQGYCYAECDSDDECAESGEVCKQQVCRLPCTVDGGECTSGYYCDTENAETGYCMLKAATTGDEQNVASGGFELSNTRIEFTNSNTTTEVTLVNKSDEWVNFTLRKVEHEALMTSNALNEVSDYDPLSTCEDNNTCPLSWIEMGEFGRIDSSREAVVRVAPNCGASCPKITIKISDVGVNATRWRGVIEVQSDVGSDRIDLSYVASPEGRWVGTMTYYANFGTQGIDTENGNLGWLDLDRDITSGVANALIQKWGGFRTGALTGGWLEMKSVLAATETSQWAFETLRDPNECLVAPEGACYLYDTGAGTLPPVYIQNMASAPIPTGVSNFPMAINVWVPDEVNAPEHLEGRVVSETALHYAGDPAITLEFADTPGETATCDTDVRSNCVHFIEDMDLAIKVGGRYALGSDQSSCASDFVVDEVPWLVPGFLQDAYVDPNSGLYYRSHCVDGRLPRNPIIDQAEDLPFNMNSAMANPIPNGRILDREVEILDGAMIDQTELFIIFRERYPSFVGGDDIVAYGYMLLKRQASQISDEDYGGVLGVPDEYEGNAPPTGLADGPAPAGAVCSRDVLDVVLGTNVALTESNAPTVIESIIYGGAPPASEILTAGGSEDVHYLCEDTGLFDGGPDNTRAWGSDAYPNTDSCTGGRTFDGICQDGLFGSTCEEGANGDECNCAAGTDASDCGLRYADTRIACPKESNITYFTTNTSLLADLSSLSCQSTGTCATTLENWITNGSPILEQVDPKWTCEGDSVFCDDNQLDRRHGKVFYKAGAQGLPFLGLHAEMDEAFRYKTRFQNRDGSSSVGFSPVICEDVGSTTPYCYDPDQIEDMRERIDCLLEVYDLYYDSAAGSSLGNANELYDYLEENFSVREEANPYGGAARSYEGFERLYSELLIMLGDEAYTSAFESRFDLAGSIAASFEGSAFEEDGINLSGVAGFEMVKLYEAVQYYDLVLERFYSMGQIIGAALDSGSPSTSRNFISNGMVTSYLDRVVRASTQRSRAMSEIARRYQGFNRPDLARKVAERTYTATYLESVFLANLILRINEITGSSERPQLLIELERSQLRYRTALTDLAGVYSEISAGINFFGFPADYIPFPTLDNSANVSAESNAFEKVLRTATNKLDVARTREQNALSSTRTYDTDQAQFQAELTRITRTYEDQLGDICGTFVGSDGLVYPAVSRYAYLDERLELIGDPCGFAGNGGIHNALGELDIMTLDIRRLAVQAQNIYEQIDIEKTRVEDQCDVTLEIADYNYDVGGELFNLEEDKIQAQRWVDTALRGADNIAKAVNIAVCDGTECAAVGPALGVLAATAIATEAAVQTGQEIAATKREERNDLNLETAKWNTEIQCDVAQINSDAQTATLALGLRDIEISVLTANLRMNLGMANVYKLRQQAKRIEMEWDEALQNSINVEAAKNDPNIRIYRNDSVINAEYSFNDALREAYRLTIVFEYYTSQTYAFRDRLFLTRMVSAGDYNLENYIYDLRNAFIDFEDQFGIPEKRVDMVSLRDDILNIPTVDDDGMALSIDERAVLLHERLRDPGLLNADGYLTIPFSTSLERLSPLTRNHKIIYIEANIEGNDNGDFLGRLYLRQTGTSTIRAIDDDFLFYRFPDRTAVINPFFNGTRQFSQDPELYRSYRLRDRPLVNSDWELIVNQRDELVNQDINLQELTDIKLYIFYQDFTIY